MLQFLTLFCFLNKQFFQGQCYSLFCVTLQIFTPHMQRTVAKTSGGSVSSNSKKGSRHGCGDEEPGSFSIDLWEKAFRDACERLCPVRAEGHECGCLSMLAKMVC